MLQSGNKMESSKMEPKKKDKKEKPKYINVNNSGKSASYSTLSFLCDLHKWVISSKSKLCLWCPNKLILNPKVYSEPCQTSKMECFVKTVNSIQLLTIFGILSLLNVCQGSGLWNHFVVLLREALKLKIFFPHLFLKGY